MRDLLTVQDGGEGDNASFGKDEGVGEDLPLAEEEVEGIRQRTAAFLLGAGR